MSGDHDFSIVFQKRTTVIDDDQILITNRKIERAKEDDVIIRQHGMFAEKLGAIIGPTYVAGKHTFIHQPSLLECYTAQLRSHQSELGEHTDSW